MNVNYPNMNVGQGVPSPKTEDANLNYTLAAISLILWICSAYKGDHTKHFRHTYNKIIFSRVLLIPLIIIGKK